MTPPELSADTLKEGRQTLEVMARPNVFAMVVALLALVGVGVLIWFDHADRSREATAQVEVMRGMLKQLETMDRRLERVERYLADGRRGSLPALGPALDREQ